MTTIIKKIEEKQMVVEQPSANITMTYKHVFKRVFDIDNPTEKDISNFYDNLMADDNTLITMVSRYLNVYPDTIHIDPKAKQVLTNS